MGEETDIRGGKTVEKESRKREENMGRVELGKKKEL